MEIAWYELVDYRQLKFTAHCKTKSGYVFALIW